MNAVSPQKQKLISAFQKSLSETVVLLLELRNRPEATRARKRKIQEAVVKLQQIATDLPSIAERRDLFSLVFDAIGQAVHVWRVFFR